MSVGQTTQLTGVLALGTLIGFAWSARKLARGGNPHRLAAFGAIIGVGAFSLLVFAAPADSALVFQIGTALMGLGGGLFAVGSLTAAMALAKAEESGIALGAWGAVQATAAGSAIAIGGAPERYRRRIIRVRPPRGGPDGSVHRLYGGLSPGNLSPFCNLGGDWSAGPIFGPANPGSATVLEVWVG